jgi:hypothetical protein
MKKLVASAVLALSSLVCLSSVAQQPRVNEPARPIAAANQPVESASVIVPSSPVAQVPNAVPSGALPADALPDAPRMEALLTPTPALLVIAVPKKIEEPRAKLVDKKFVGLGALVFATTSLDMEFTQHCLQRNTCVELNPTLPTSHWGMYATNTPVNLGVMWLAHKRRAGGHRDWWIWPALDAGIHVYGVTTNARYEFGKR